MRATGELLWSPLLRLGGMFKKDKTVTEVSEVTGTKQCTWENVSVARRRIREFLWNSCQYETGAMEELLGTISISRIGVWFVNQ